MAASSLQEAPGAGCPGHGGPELRARAELPVAPGAGGAVLGVTCQRPRHWMVPDDRWIGDWIYKNYYRMIRMGPPDMVVGL